MGYDTMIDSAQGLSAGKQVTRPFTDVWAKRSAGWQLIARQATIAETKMNSQAFAVSRFGHSDGSPPLELTTQLPDE